MKQTLILGAFLAFVFTLGIGVTPKVADAACSANGYMNSGGKCAKSFAHWDDDDDDDDEDDDDDDKWEKKEKKAKKNKKFDYGWNYGYGYGGVNEERLQAYINELLALIERLKAVQGNGGNGGDISAYTQSATDIDEDSATLRATVDMMNEDDGELYFEYGKSSSNLNEDSDTLSLDESDDDDTLEESIDGLDDDTRYYFRAVARDENGDKRYGAILSFVTDSDGSSNNDDVPDVTTNSAQNIDTDSADLRGEVDMNDYENGTSFFVFGEDEDQVADVEDDFDTWSEVDEDGDNLRKVLVDSDVDGNESYTRNVSGLDENTDIYYAFCVEYDDEDDDETLICGSVRSFETD